VSRARLAALFWPVEDETRSRRSLRQALTELRRAVGEVLQEQGETVGIAGGLELDASRFEAAVTRGDYQAAMDLWGGEFLADVEDTGGQDLRTWLEAERAGLKRRFAIAAEARADAAEREGAWDAALAVGSRWTEVLPEDQRAWTRHGQLQRLAGRRAKGGASHAAFAALLSPDLIARHAQFSTLTRQWEAVKAGAPGLALIEGEEGVGKSRLIEEFLRWLGGREPRAVVLRARAFEAERDRMGVLARHLLAPLAAVPGVAAAPASALKPLAALVPEVAERFPALPVEVPADHLSDGVARVLADVAVEAPVVIAVDDADLADRESLELLEALCRRPVAGVLVLLSALPNRLPALAGLERRGDYAGSPVRLHLDVLRVADVEQLIASMAEFVPEDRAVLAGRLHGESGGNPLVVIELLASLAAQGTIAPDTDGRWGIRALADGLLPVPSSLREAMTARLRQLTPDATRVLQSAAVLGRDAEVGLLGNMTGLEPARLEEAVAQAVGHRLLKVAEGSATRLEFTYEAARRVVYEELLPLRRGELHRRAYRILRRRRSRDSSQLAAVGYHRMRGAEIPVWRRYALRAAAAGTAALGVGAFLLLTGRQPPPTSPTAIAVLPFEVREGGRYSYLGDGMVDLLSADLDGLGGLRSVDPNTLLTVISRRSSGGRDPERGRSVAQRLGAGLFVVGEVTEAGGRGQVVAYLYDARGRLQTVARASAESEADTYRVVDEIARQLLAGRHQGPAEALTRLAVVTTPSVPALKAYLEGERRLREGAFGSAVEAFQTAIAADTAFALAHYRLAVAAEWDERSELSEHAAEQAARFGGRLSGHHALLVQGLLAWRKGDAASAEITYRQIVRDHREDMEAWFQLGEVLFHANPLRGRSLVEAREPWEWVRSREPGNRFAVLHLARIAALQDDSARLAALVEPGSILEPVGDRRVLELAGWRALVIRNREEEERMNARLRQAGHLTLQNVAWQLVSWSRNLAGSERIARLILDLEPNDVAAHLILAHLDLARGMRRRAVTDLPTGEGADEPLMLIIRAYFAALDFVPVSAPELLRLRRELTAWRPRAIPIGPEGPEAMSLHRAAAPLLREYLLGTLCVRLGDLAGAARSAASLEGALGDTPEERLAETLALGMRALIARSQGHPEAALQLLERIRQPARREEVSQSPFHAVALERYLRADLLRELGRDEEALGWYASLGELSPFELVFLAPSHLRQAEIYERLGRRSEAAKHYAQFIDLWGDADPEFQPVVSEAGTRLRELRR
jgi:tetratricopeptide (TPR) repeat protein